MRVLQIDGHHFNVTERKGEAGTYDFDWVTGPNSGYGFTSATNDGSPLTATELEARARDFLAIVDPATGYIEDDD